MSDKTSIEWTNTYHPDGTVTAGSTWNPIRGQNARHTCARISPGCDNCYAATMTRRGLGGTAPIDFGVGEKPNDPARLDETALLQPFRWKKPRKIFVCSMTDLFGTWVPDEWIDRVFGVMALTPWHTYILLTKRPSRMHEYMTRLPRDLAPGKFNVIEDDGTRRPGTDIEWRILGIVCETFKIAPGDVLNRAAKWRDPEGDSGLMAEWPLANVWVGTTIEADAYVWRANKLRETPAAVRWISAEPLLSGLPSLDLTGVDWLVAGGESGPGARPMHPDWPRALRDRCQAAGVAYFFKQWGAYLPAIVSWDVEGGGQVGLHAHFQDGSIDGHQGARDHWWEPARCDNHPNGAGPGVVSARVGNHKSGRLLDGREHNEFPSSRAGVSA